MYKGRGEWVRIADRKPRHEDADAWGCVLIWDRYNGVRVTGYRNHQMLDAEYVTHWARIPDGPGEEGEGSDK